MTSPETYLPPTYVLLAWRKILARRVEAAYYEELGRVERGEISLARAWYTVPKLAGRLAISRACLYRAIKAGCFTHRRAEGRYNPAHEIYADGRLVTFCESQDIDIKLIQP